MATPKRGGEIIDINGRIAMQVATAQEIADARGGTSPGGTTITAADTARAIVYDITKDNRAGVSGVTTSVSGLAVTLIAGNKIALTDDGSIVEGRLESVEIDGMCTVTGSAQVMHFKGRGAIVQGNKLIGTRATSATAGAYGYVRAAAQPAALDPSTAGDPTDAELASYNAAVLEAVNGRGSVLSGGSGTAVRDIRTLFRIG